MANITGRCLRYHKNHLAGAVQCPIKESLLKNEPSSNLNRVADSRKLSFIESAVSFRCSHFYSAFLMYSFIS